MGDFNVLHVNAKAIVNNEVGMSPLTSYNGDLLMNGELEVPLDGVSLDVYEFPFFSLYSSHF
jgi:hypothetical protein